MQSINANDGSTTIQVSFEVGTNLDNANMLTQNRVAIANSQSSRTCKGIGHQHEEVVGLSHDDCIPVFTQQHVQCAVHQ